jgi:hypothetical protein
MQKIKLINNDGFEMVALVDDDSNYCYTKTTYELKGDWDDTHKIKLFFETREIPATSRTIEMDKID